MGYFCIYESEAPGANQRKIISDIPREKKNIRIDSAMPYIDEGGGAWPKTMKNTPI